MDERDKQTRFSKHDIEGVRFALKSRMVPSPHSYATLEIQFGSLCDVITAADILTDAMEFYRLKPQDLAKIDAF